MIWEWLAEPYNQPTTNGDIVLGMAMMMVTGIILCLTVLGCRK